ncbi:calcium/proton exchanger [Microaerobacter geothermalis]|uniref:calcium/proton exchanger n=1 Tax=Microaerobacter geothermalis TaxID=674972 RepID=UPI001F38B5FF|nr:calcium/proton exchanger [Microaerobacter geothermalis]MCF6094954.1 calcium/proton exchanger [Microaerobacter geothermalis]
MRQSIFFSLAIFTVLLSAFAQYFTSSTGFQFASASIAIIFLAGLLGKATESVAHYAGDRIGGFLNATFGNAAELIIAIFLIKEGLFEMVKASITGSIIGNLLLVLGLSLLAGGVKYKFQHFNPILAGHNASLMLLGVIALFIPAIYLGQLEQNSILTLSFVVAGVLILSYILWLIFSMITHKEELADNVHEGSKAVWSLRISIFLLVIATFFVAVESEWLVAGVEEVAESLGWSELFVGAFLIAIIGNAAEHSAAILLAIKNRIGASVEIAIGSSLQIALFVGPVLVFISLLFGNPMDIVFSPIELTAIAVSAFIAKSISRDGMTNWFEGVLLLVVYIILGTAFFFVS